MNIYMYERFRLKLSVSLFILLLTALAVSVSSFAEVQPSSINVSGYVNTDFTSQDQSLKAGFKVEIVENGRSVLSDSNGYFEVLNVPVSSSQTVYTVKISKAGYLTRTLSNVTVIGNAFVGSQGTPVEIWPGDIVQDNAVNMTDVMEISKSFNSALGDSRFLSLNDLNKDNAVNMTDIMIIVRHFNQIASDYPVVNYTTHTQTPQFSPTQTPTPTSSPQTKVNLIKNGDFSNGISDWTLWTEAGAVASNSVVSGQYKTSISNSGPNPWSVHIYQGNFSLISGKEYELSFEARSTINRNIKPSIENATDYTQYFYTNVAINSIMSKYTFRFSASSSDALTRIVFSIGSIDGLISQSHDVYLDNIVIHEVGPGNTTPNPTPTPFPSSTTDWKLVWSDEFSGTNGTKPDAAKWAYDIGGGGWGNNELEYYTDSDKNSYQENGHLVIKAIKENFGGNSYTSARLRTQGKFEQTYGKFEARMKIPYGQGIWPAFWMLGNNIGSVSWPGCGEIDIMENIGKEPDLIHGTIHGPGYSAANGPSSSYTGQRFSDSYHTYTIEWETNIIRWYCDGILYGTKTNKDIGSNTWVYDHPFFMIMNVAVGGGWPGNPDATTVFPQVMEVDYVRVYQR